MSGAPALAERRTEPEAFAFRRNFFLRKAAARPPFSCFGASMTDHAHTPPSPYATGLAARCPHCGEGKLFDGYLKLRPRCAACGLDFGFADSADGPAVFIMLIAGFAVLGAALYVEIAYEPPIWLHLAIWLPLAVIVCLALLRPMKGLAVSLQYAHKAAEGRLEK
jgi:uncharacterized protein (DUF983 family)